MAKEKAKKNFKSEENNLSYYYCREIFNWGLCTSFFLKMKFFKSAEKAWNIKTKEPDGKLERNWNKFSLKKKQKLF